MVSRLPGQCCATANSDCPGKDGFWFWSGPHSFCILAEKYFVAQFPYQQFSTAGIPLHFAHANGYPPDAYRSLLAPLQSDFAISAMLFRPLQPGRSLGELRSWWQLADDLNTFLEERDRGPVLGVGHSLGAVVTMLAASRRPELFRRIVIIEPVFLPPVLYAITSLIPIFLRNYVVPPARIARKRRDRWASREEAYAHLRKKRVFARVSDEIMRDIVEAGISDADSGATLQYSKAWEARTYSTLASPWRAMKQVRIPVLGLRGIHTDTVPDASWQRWQRVQPGARLVQHEKAGHLLPFEDPVWVQRQLQGFFAEANSG